MLHIPNAGRECGQHSSSYRESEKTAEGVERLCQLPGGQSEDREVIEGTDPVQSL